MKKNFIKVSDIDIMKTLVKLGYQIIDTQNGVYTFLTVSNYLYKGNELGFCSYYPANKIRIKVHIEDQDFSFNTINECVRSLSKLYHNIPWSMFKVAAHKRDTDFRGIKIQYI